MIDITDKVKTLRQARATATISMSPDSVEKIKKGEVPKGDVFEVSRAVAILSAKKVAEIFPFCHNIPVTHVDVDFSFDGNKLRIDVLVKTVYQTGCEIEALFAASVCAINIYDMLKPIDKNVEIKEVKLVEKSGGKSDFAQKVKEGFKAGVLVISDSVYEGKKEDKAGKTIKKELEKLGINLIDYRVVPDEPEMIREVVLEWCNSGFDLVLTTGGTGLSPRDRTPEAIEPLLERKIPGIMEGARQYGFERTPYAMLSRGIAGVRGKTLIITLPGSSRGAKESMQALFPYVLHAYRALEMKRHD